MRAFAKQGSRCPLQSTDNVSGDNVADSMLSCTVPFNQIVRGSGGTKLKWRKGHIEVEKTSSVEPDHSDQYSEHSGRGAGLKLNATTLARHIATSKQRSIHGLYTIPC